MHAQGRQDLCITTCVLGVLALQVSGINEDPSLGCAASTKAQQYQRHPPFLGENGVAEALEGMTPQKPACRLAGHGPGFGLLEARRRLHCNYQQRAHSC